MDLNELVLQTKKIIGKVKVELLVKQVKIM